METLVFIGSGKAKTEPYTTSKVIAENTEIKHASIIQRIQQYQNDIAEFGRVCFKNEPLSTAGGKQLSVYYDLSEQQAYFLLTLLRNKPKVIEFKKNLVKAFFAMRTELMRRQIAKMERKPIRKALTDGIKYLPDSPHKGRQFGNYTNLIYKIVLGKNAKQIREERGAPKRANVSNLLTAEELEAVTQMEYRVSVMLELGMNYSQIKSALSNLKLVGHVA